MNAGSSPRAPAAASGGGLGAAPPSARFVWWVVSKRLRWSSIDLGSVSSSGLGGVFLHGQSAIRERAADGGAHKVTCTRVEEEERTRSIYK